MRDILFKAKRIDYDKWVEGYYAYFSHLDDNHCMYYHYDGIPLVCDINPDTLCQYTGLKDKNGKKIFEGDLILLMDRWYCAVEYDVENARFILNGEHVKNEDKDELTHSSFAPYYQNEIEVIGNIFDNPELLNADNEASQQAHQEVLKLATD